MAKLKLTPLLAVSPPIIGGMIDRATSARWDMAMEEVTVIVAGNEAKISALWDRVAHRWQNIDVTIYAHASSTTAARVNRLLTGTGAPRAETYHRTGTIVIRARQHAYPLPASHGYRAATGRDIQDDRQDATDAGFPCSRRSATT